MNQIVKLEVTVMGRPLWIEIKETDKDPEFIKLKVEKALQIWQNIYDNCRCEKNK